MLNSLSTTLAKSDPKGKAVLHPSLAPASSEVGIGGAIRNLLPKDLLGSLPQVSGPFQLVETEDRKRKLDGPLSAVSLATQPGPVYVYIANYRPPPAPAYLPPPVGLPAWRLTSDGKDRSRGPRKCGYCGKFDCRGRGGRTWCPDYRAGVPGIVSKKGRRSSGLAKEEDDDDDDDELDEDEVEDQDDDGRDDDFSYSALANFRGDVHQSSPNLSLLHGNTSNSGNAHAGPSHAGNSVPSSLAPFQTGPRNHLVLGAGSGSGLATDVEVHQSVISLIQSILPPSTDGVRNFSADFLASAYRGHGPPITGYATSGIDIYGNETGEGGVGGLSTPPVATKKPRAPRHCVVCKKQECAGKSQRSRCKEYVPNP